MTKRLLGSRFWSWECNFGHPEKSLRYLSYFFKKSPLKFPFLLHVFGEIKKKKKQLGISKKNFQVMALYVKMIVNYCLVKRFWGGLKAQDRWVILWFVSFAKLCISVCRRNKRSRRIISFAKWFRDTFVWNKNFKLSG